MSGPLRRLWTSVAFAAGGDVHMSRHASLIAFQIAPVIGPRYKRRPDLAAGACLLRIKTRTRLFRAYVRFRHSGPGTQNSALWEACAQCDRNGHGLEA